MAAAQIMSLAPPLPTLSFPVFAVNREYLYEFIAEISKLARIPFFPELLALLGSPGAGDLHLPNGLRRWYKSIQSQCQALGRAGNSGIPGLRMERLLPFTSSLFHFLREGEAVPGWKCPQGVPGALAPGFCLSLVSVFCLPCPTRIQCQLRGIWVEILSFPDIFLGVTFSKPSLYPTLTPRIHVAVGE